MNQVKKKLINYRKNFTNLNSEFKDKTAHQYGPYSKEVKEKLNKIDQTIGYLLEQINNKKLSDSLNLIITSDHGKKIFSSKNSKI
jgi:membrane-anchored protein YejM (alkaline phosphatase superfamily)